jgi:hypothetical protein
MIMQVLIISKFLALGNSDIYKFSVIKIFFFDTGRVIEDEGARVENAVACALLKRWCPGPTSGWMWAAAPQGE